jgi:hypothetical protein
MATGESREGGGRGAQTFGVLYPQAGRPASAMKETGGRGVPRPGDGAKLPSLAHALSA